MAKNDTTTPTATPSDNLVLVDANSLAATIATAVAQAMAAMQTQQNNSQTLGDAIGAAVAQGMAASTRRKMTFGEYVQRGPLNAYHPKPFAETPKLKVREVYQNGVLLDFNTLFDGEVELINRITHSGRFINRLVEVGVADDVIHINYKSAKPDQRFENTKHWRDLAELLRKVVAEQEEEDRQTRELEEERRAEKQKREDAKAKFSFGKGKASQEAREAAGVE